MTVTKLSDISFTIVEIERKNKVPMKHYGKHVFMEKTFIDNNPKLKREIDKKYNILKTHTNVNLILNDGRLFFRWKEDVITIKDIHIPKGSFSMEGEFAEADKIEEINEMSYAKNKTSVVVNCTMLYPVSEIRGIIVKKICAISKKSA